MGGSVFNPRPVYPHEFKYSEAELWRMLRAERAEKKKLQEIEDRRKIK